MSIAFLEGHGMRRGAGGLQLAPDGEEVWSYQLGAGRLTIVRAYRR